MVCRKYLIHNIVDYFQKTFSYTSSHHLTPVINFLLNKEPNHPSIVLFRSRIITVWWVLSICFWRGRVLAEKPDAGSNQEEWVLQTNIRRDYHIITFWCIHAFDASSSLLIYQYPNYIWILWYCQREKMQSRSRHAVTLIHLCFLQPAPLNMIRFF